MDRSASGPTDFEPLRRSLFKGWVGGVEYHIVRSIGNFCFGPSDMQSSADEAGIDVQCGFAGVGRKTAGVQQGTEIVEVGKFTTTIPEVLSLWRYFVERL